MTRCLLTTLALLAAAAGCDGGLIRARDMVPGGPDMSVGCEIQMDCDGSPGGPICYQGLCVVCGTDADCPKGKKCDAHRACVECLTAADCMAGMKCASGACATGCDDKSPCPTGQVCDMGKGVCVQCTADKDCAGLTPKCDPSTSQCVGCLVDGDCGTGKVCNQRACVVGCTAAHPDCGAGKVCKTEIGACVDCLVDGDCKAASLPRCEAIKNVCVACLPTGDNCPAGQYCAATACEPGCKDDGDCAAGGKSSKCDLTRRACVGCLDDGGCPLGQVCQAQACVDGCNDMHGCPTGEGCCAGACQKLLTDAKNCGACGKACDAGKACCAGACADLSSPASCGACGNACDAGKGCCSGACTDLASTANCGACGKACGGGESCCASGCADTKADAANCGACGKACDKGSACCAGVCTDVLKDPKSCGACGKACDKGGFCLDGACVAPSSCAEILKNDPTAASGVYTIDPDGGGTVQPFKAYCDMTSDGGGWTLILKIDGKKTTFAWSAALWTNADTYQPQFPDLDTNEAKLAAFSSLAYSNLRLGLVDGGTTRWMVVPSTSPSLLDALKGDYKATSVGRDKWRSLLASPSLQWNCSREGYNAYGPSATVHARVRIGIVGNQENDCATTDSWIGFGGDQGGGCGYSPTTSCGNVAYCGGDNGDRDTAAFGYVMAR